MAEGPGGLSVFRRMAAVVGILPSTPARAALLAKVRNVVQIEAEILDEIGGMVDGGWENAGVEEKLREVREMKKMISRVVEVHAAEETADRSTVQGAATLNEDTNTSEAAECGAAGQRRLVPIYSNFPITQFYRVGGRGAMPPVLFTLANHIISLNIEVSPLNACYTKHCMPEAGEQATLSATFGADFGPFTGEEDGRILARVQHLVTSGVITSSRALSTALRLVQELPTMCQFRPTLNIVGLFFGQDLPDRLAIQLCYRATLLIDWTLEGTPARSKPPSSSSSSSYVVNSTLNHTMAVDKPPLEDFPTDLSTITGPQANPETLPKPSSPDPATPPHRLAVTLNSSNESSGDESSHFLLESQETFYTPPTSRPAREHHCFRREI